MQPYSPATHEPGRDRAGFRPHEEPGFAWQRLCFMIHPVGEHDTKEETDAGAVA